jgi:hypothetical protein
MQTKTASQAPPWLISLLTPLIARLVARAMVKKYPGLGASEIAEKMRADIPSGLDPKQGRRFIDAVVARLPETVTPVPVTERPVSAWVLVAANLLPLYGVLVWNWEVFPLLALFWMENVIIGALNAARMLAIDPGDAALWAAKLFMVPFFCVHYGFFTVAHGVFVFSMFGKYNAEGFDVQDPAARAVSDWNLWLPVGALLASHVFSFFWNYPGVSSGGLQEQMMKPYARVVILHLTVLVGGFGVVALGSPLWALLILLGIKIAVDVRAHLREHRG